MSSIKCENCGAPLQIEPKQKIAHCTYCNTDQRVGAEDPEVRYVEVPVPMPAAAPPKRKKAKGSPLLLALAVLIFAGFIAFIFHTMKTNESDFDKESKRMQRDFDRESKKMDEDFKRMQNQPLGSGPWGTSPGGRIVITPDPSGMHRLSPAQSQQIRQLIRQQQLRPPRMMQ